MKVYDYKKYLSFTEIYQDIICDLIDNPQYKIAPRGIPVREMVNVTVVAHPKDVHIDFTKTQAPERQPVYDKYKKEELEWYLSGNTLASSAPSKFWLRLADDKGHITSNYGYMMLFDKLYSPSKPDISDVPTLYVRKILPDAEVPTRTIRMVGDRKTAFEKVINDLTKDPHSRQAVVHYNQPLYCYENNLDYPCTMHSQFFVRDGKLKMLTNMRSCDIFLGYSFDLPWNAHFMTMILDELNSKGMNLELGDLTMVFGSLHLYEKNLEIAEKIALNAE